MIKILFIHNKLVCGGAEQALFDLVSLIDKKRFNVTILVQYDGGIWEEKFRNAGLRVVSIWDCQKKTQNPLIKLRNRNKRKRITESLKNDGAGLLDVCLNEHFDIIVAFNGSTLQSMCFSGKAKTVKYIHGDMATNPEFCKNTMAILECIRKFDRIVCVSKASKRSFMELTGITDNVVLHYNPLNTETVRSLSEHIVSIPKDVPYICAVGRLAPEKGYDRLIRIHKKLVDEGFLHKLILVGDGEEISKLHQLVADCHAEETVVFAGYQSNPYPYMKNSQFLVCSSYTEGLPVVAMEALSLGIPIVSSAPSVQEAFGDEMCGLITGNDDMSLESGIRRMFEDRVFYQHAKEGAERRSEFFVGKRMVKEVEETFISLLNEGK